MSALTQAATARTMHGKPCSIGEAVAKLDPDSAADFRRWMAGGLDLTDQQMHGALQALGHRVGEQSVGRHRRGDCRCGQ